MRLKMTPIALAATLTLVAVLSTTSDIAHGGGHGPGGDDGFGGGRTCPAHGFGDYATGSHSFCHAC
jgi:hypothetical protein